MDDVGLPVAGSSAVAVDTENNAITAARGWRIHPARPRQAFLIKVFTAIQL
jgi:hypothetical protein